MLTHRPWIRATSPLRSTRILHLDAYVMADTGAAYLDVHASLGGSLKRARDVFDVTSYAPDMVRVASLPDATHAVMWTARATYVPWRRLHAYVRQQAELLHPRQLGSFPWSTVSLVCHYVPAPDLDAFKGFSRSTTKRNAQSNST